MKGIVSRHIPADKFDDFPSFPSNEGDLEPAANKAASASAAVQRGSLGIDFYRGRLSPLPACVPPTGNL